MSCNDNYIPSSQEWDSWEDCRGAAEGRNGNELMRRGKTGEMLKD